MSKMAFVYGRKINVLNSFSVLWMFDNDAISSMCKLETQILLSCLDVNTSMPSENLRIVGACFTNMSLSMSGELKNR